MQSGRVLLFQKAQQHRSVGTTVSVRDLFYCLPVRRKEHSNAAVELERVRQRVMRLLLVNPGVAVTLTDASRSQVILTRPKVLRADITHAIASRCGMHAPDFVALLYNAHTQFLSLATAFGQFYGSSLAEQLDEFQWHFATSTGHGTWHASGLLARTATHRTKVR
jgi:DNA mismatch repair ATPase MutL